MTCDELRGQYQSYINAINGLYSQWNAAANVLNADFLSAVTADGFNVGGSTVPGYPVDPTAINNRINALQAYAQTLANNPALQAKVNNAISKWQTALNDYWNCNAIDCQIEGNRASLSNTVQQMIAQGC